MEEYVFIWLKSGFEILINVDITHDDGVTDNPGTVVDRVPPQCSRVHLGHNLAGKFLGWNKWNDKTLIKHITVIKDIYWGDWEWKKTDKLFIK